jgi:hypothetical protein
LSNNGKILQEYYSNPFVLRDLIDLGGLSSLRPQIGTKHPFSHYDTDLSVVEFANLYQGMCVFYGRDRGEGQSDATYYNDYLHFLVDGQEEEYDYLLRNIDGVATWFVSDHNGDFMLLTEAFAKEAQAELEVA